jgi:hypothetical protein
MQIAKGVSSTDGMDHEVTRSMRTSSAPLGSVALALVTILLLSACETGSTDVVGGATGPTETASTGPTAATGSTATTGSTGAATLEGTWEGTWGAKGFPNAGTFSMVITPVADGFEGTIEIQNSQCVTNGTVTIGLEGDQITFGAVEAEKEVSFTGEVSADRMSGTWEATSCPPPSTGIWEAVRSG